jgi:hypothetical protein
MGQSSRREPKPASPCDDGVPGLVEGHRPSDSFTHGCIAPLRCVVRFKPRNMGAKGLVREEFLIEVSAVAAL